MKRKKIETKMKSKETKTKRAGDPSGPPYKSSQISKP